RVNRCLDGSDSASEENPSISVNKTVRKRLSTPSLLACPDASNCLTRTVGTYDENDSSARSSNAIASLRELISLTEERLFNCLSKRNSRIHLARQLLYRPCDHAGNDGNSGGKKNCRGKCRDKYFRKAKGATSFER